MSEVVPTAMFPGNRVLRFFENGFRSGDQCEHRRSYRRVAGDGRENRRIDAAWQRSQNVTTLIAKRLRPCQSVH
jgi:hypothetical protein